MSALIWKLRFVRRLRAVSQRGLSLRYCWMAAGAALESYGVDLDACPEECAEDEFDACLACC